MGCTAFHLKADGVKRLQPGVAQRKTFTDIRDPDSGRRRMAALRCPYCRLDSLQIAQQLAGVGVLWRADDIRGEALFLNFSVAKNQQPVGTLRRQRQIVGDEQYRRPGLPAQGIEEVENTFLYGDIEGAGWLVGNDQVRLQGNGDRN